MNSARVADEKTINEQKISGGAVATSTAITSNSSESNTQPSPPFNPALSGVFMPSTSNKLLHSNSSNSKTHQSLQKQQSNDPQTPKQSQQQLRNQLDEKQQQQRPVYFQKPLLKKSILASVHSKGTEPATQPTNSSRKDRFGIDIDKKLNHRICFNPEIVEVFEVENWKAYNIIEEPSCAARYCSTF